MTLDELNVLPRDRFVEAVGWVFEHSPWVAERTWAQRPFASLDALHDAMVETMRSGSAAEQVALIRAHPDLGTRLAMSAASTGEQSGAGLDRLPPPLFAELQRLSTAYKERFGFPFLFAVRGSTPDEILQALRERVRRGPDGEFEEALRQVARIARFRLEQALATGATR